MDKLTKLLNEYREQNGEESINESELFQTLDSNNYLKLFVEWLVYNDKIAVDFAVKESGVPAIIMLLSLSKNPIRFLISILK